MIAETIDPRPHPSLVRTRWSAGSFASRMVESSRLLRLLEAARWTPSYANEQPWSFVVASKEDSVAHDRLLGCVAESNIAKAGRAPVLILAVVKLNFEAGGHPNPYAFHDAGKAMANLTRKAAAMGMLAHQMSGFDAVGARKLFSIPTGHTPVAVIAVGYPDVGGPTDNRGTDGDSQARRPLESLIFTDRWGESSPLLTEASPDPCD